MVRRQRTRQARSAVAAAAVLALGGSVLLVASPANAATSVPDSFEGNPYDRWTTEDVAGFSFANLENHQHARTGANIAWLDAYPPSVYSARVYRSLTLDRPGAGPAWCYGEVYLKRSSIELPRPEKVRVTAQIRSGGPSGTRVDGATFELTQEHQDTYWRAGFASFDYRPGPLTVDISARSGTVLVDDVTVWCIRQIQ